MAGKGPQGPELISILWLAQHDPDPATAEGALDLWDDCGCAVPPEFGRYLLRFLCSQHADIRVAAAEALAFGLQVYALRFSGNLGLRYCLGAKAAKSHGRPWNAVSGVH